jgi:hypothetical protein
MKESEKARSSFQLVLDKYPESVFTVPAKRFLEKMDRAGAPAPLRGG